MTELNVIDGGRADRRRLGQISVVLSDRAALGARRIVYEEDTHLVLSAPAEVPERAPAPLRVLTAALEAEPTPVGRLLDRDERWLAVVHDLDEEPSTSAQVVERMLRRALDLADAQQLERLAFEALGAVHGPLTPLESFELLLQALGARPLEFVRRVDFIASDDRRVRAQLERRLALAATEWPSEGQMPK